MAIAGIDTQGGNQFAILQNVSQRGQSEEARAEASQEARFGADSTSETEAQQARLGTEDNLGTQTGTGVPGQSLDSSSLNALIQAAQEQDDAAPTVTTDAPAATGIDEEQEEALLEQANAGNSTNSLAPGAPSGATDGRGISFLV